MGSSIKQTLSELIEDLDLRCCFNSCRPPGRQHHLPRDHQVNPIQADRSSYYPERPTTRIYSERPRLHPFSEDSLQEDTRDFATQTGHQLFPDSHERGREEADVITVQRVNQGTQTVEPGLSNTVDEQEDFRLSYRPQRPQYREEVVHEPLSKHNFSHVPPHVHEIVRISQPSTVRVQRITDPQERTLDSEFIQSFPHQVHYRQFGEGAQAHSYEMTERSERDRSYGYGSDEYSNNETRHDRSVWADERGRRGKYTPWCIAVGFVIALCSIGIPLLLIGAILIFVGEGDSATYKAGLALLIIASIMAIVGIAIIIMLYSGFCGKKPNSVFGTRRSRFQDPSSGPSSSSRQFERYPQPLRPTYPADEPSYRSHYRGGNYDYRSPRQGNWSQNNRKSHSNDLTDGNESFEDYEETENKTYMEPNQNDNYETRRKTIKEVHDRKGQHKIRSPSPHPGRFVIQEQPRPRAAYHKPVLIEHHRSPTSSRRPRIGNRRRYQEPQERERHYEVRPREIHPDEAEYYSRPRQVIYEDISHDESHPQSPKSEPEKVRSLDGNDEPAPPMSPSRSTERSKKKKEKKKPRHRSVKLEDPKEEEIGGIPVSKKKKNRRHHARFRNNRGHPYAWDKLPQSSPQKVTIKKKKPISGPLRDRYYNDDDSSTESNSPPAYEPGTKNAYPWYVDKAEHIKPKPSKNEPQKVGARTAWEEDVKTLPDRVYNYHNYLRNVLGNVQWPSRDHRRSYPEPKPRAREYGEHPPKLSLDSEAPARFNSSSEKFFSDDLIANLVGHPKVAGRRIPFDNDDMMRKLC